MSDLPCSFANTLRKKLDKRSPRIAIILGSGLGTLGAKIENPLYIPYSEIPGFPQSTVAGHQGRFIAGTLCGKEVLCMQGRFHLYEGYAPYQIADVIKAFKLLGITTLVVTNAAGSLRKEMQPGSLMLITDHLNFSGFNPLIGPNDERFGVRFPPMHNIYTSQYLDLARQIAQRENLPLREGTYCMVSGPNFETPAEIRAFQILGADANGMSTVPETITAAYCGINVLAISAITNYCTGIEGGCPSHTETLSTAKQASAALTALVCEFIREL